MRAARAHYEMPLQLSLGVIQPPGFKTRLIVLNPDAIKHQVQTRLDELRRKSYKDLLALPAWISEQIPFGDLQAELITYRDGVDGGDVTIAVQCFPPGSRRGVFWVDVYADGFHVAPDGAIRAMLERDRYAYM